jgi:hypothetical protein
VRPDSRRAYTAKNSKITRGSFGEQRVRRYKAGAGGRLNLQGAKETPEVNDSNES